MCTDKSSRSRLMIASRKHAERYQAWNLSPLQWKQLLKGATGKTMDRNPGLSQSHVEDLEKKYGKTRGGGLVHNVPYYLCVRILLQARGRGRGKRGGFVVTNPSCRRGSVHESSVFAS